VKASTNIKISGILFAKNILMKWMPLKAGLEGIAHDEHKGKEGGTQNSLFSLLKGRRVLAPRPILEYWQKTRI